MAHKKSLKLGNRNSLNKRFTVAQVMQFDKKWNSLKEKIFSDETLIESINDSMNTYFKEQSKFIVFISVCNGKSRAIVKKATGSTLEEAWENSCVSIKKHLGKLTNYHVKWIKLDIVKEIEEKEYTEVCKELKQSREFFYKKGISFDREFKIAVLESELNGRAIFDYKKKEVSLEGLNEYFTETGIQTIEKIPDKVCTFTCKSYLFDDSIYELYDAGYDYGRRKIDKLDKETVYDILTKSSNYLINMLQEDGKFIYGYYPIRGNRIGGYNILRHASSLWGLNLCYRITKNEDLNSKIRLGIDYLLHRIISYNDETSFLVDENLNEIKLGGNAVAIIMLTEYMDTFQTDEFGSVIEKLGNGILKLQNPNTGEFFHVLNSFDFSPKAKDRTVYYDGEAAFALMRLYAFFKDEKWLNAAKLAFQYFVENDYYQYADHWVSYAVNEYLKNEWDESILNLGVTNVSMNLDRIYRRDTTYHTFLELLMSAFEMMQTVMESNLKSNILSEFNMAELCKVIIHRANHQLNGFFYPELAMYLKRPEIVLNTFCVRHDAFRIRIDDIQHNIDGYYYFYRYFDLINDYVKEL